MLTTHKMIYVTTQILWYTKCCVHFKTDCKLLLCFDWDIIYIGFNIKKTNFAFV